MALATPERFGRYRVIAELGAGPVATVYKAVQEPLGRAVAVKALRPTVVPSSPFAAPIEREARLLAELAHPNIVVCHDFVRTDTSMYLVVEYVDGFSVAELLSKKARLTPDVVAHVGAQVARALEHAHQRGIVHRDVKPSNVLLSRRGEVKVLDFGIAQREKLPTADEPLPATQSEAARDEGFGTPAYMSPEQILGEFVDARSDVFSLGVMLYECLAGVRPFEPLVRRDGDRRAVAQRTRRDPPTPLHARVADVPRSLERVVMRALEKLPADRFASAGDLAEALEETAARSSHAARAALVTGALVQAGLMQADRGSENDAAMSVAREPERPSLRGALLGYLVLSAAIVAGAVSLQLRNRGVRDVGGSGAPLELVPAAAGGLRVLATPWAEVAVDGQRIDVTPFARAIPLAAGTHYVTLTHPSAPREKRVIQIAPGETTLLDVTMSIPPAAPGASAAATP